MSKKIRADGSLDRQAASIKLVVFDFDGVFTDNTVYVNDKGEETVRCWRGDGLGLTSLKNAGVKIRVVSTEKNPVVLKRCRKLSISCKTGVSDKAKTLKNLTKDLKISLVNTAFVGNDINDIECMKIVGLPVAVGDAYPEVKRIAKYVTARPGGLGAVREICDYIVNSKLKDIS